MRYRYRRAAVTVFLFAMITVIWILTKLHDAKPAACPPCLTDSKYNVFRDDANTIGLPLIYIITPTVKRHEQKADLTRLSHTLRLVPRLHWIVIEDRDEQSDIVKKFLARCGVPFTHLSVQTDYAKLVAMKLSGKFGKFWQLPKGVEQRNLALDWLTKHAELPSVFYFADDDNTYDLQLFDEMRYTKIVSVWPVGLVGNAQFQAPVVENGKVTGWVAGWVEKRKYVIDMAGFAVNSKFLTNDNPPRLNYLVGKGFVETNFLEQLPITKDNLEPRADECTKVLVWHTRTSSSPMNFNGNLTDSLRRYDLKFLEV